MDGATDVVQIQSQIIEFKSCFPVTNKNAIYRIFLPWSLYKERNGKGRKGESKKK